jgi:hypothetical protein
MLMSLTPLPLPFVSPQAFSVRPRSSLPVSVAGSPASRFYPVTTPSASVAHLVRLFLSWPRSSTRGCSALLDLAVPVSRRVQRSGKWGQASQLEVGKTEEAVVCMSKTITKFLSEGLQSSCTRMGDSLHPIPVHSRPAP